MRLPASTTLALAGAALAASPALAADLPLDTTFGDAGATMLAIGDTWAQANDALVQPDGRIVLAGRANVGGADPGPRVAIARLLPDGTPDASFGGGDGVVTIKAGDGGEARAIVQQADGKLLAVGTTDADWGAMPRWSLVRVDADGALDDGFGDGGVVEIGFGPFAGEEGIGGSASSVALEGDGQVVVAGFEYFEGSTMNVQRQVVARFDADGELDTSFGDGGYVDFALGSGNEEPVGVGVTDAGRIVVGSTPYVGGRYQAAVAALTSDGGFDMDFGDDGVRTLDLADADLIGSDLQGMTLLGDGSVVLAGQGSGPDGWALAFGRLTADGGVDTAFGDGGRVQLPLEGTSAVANDVAVAHDGSLVAAGSAGEELAVARVRADGTPIGIQTHRFGGMSPAYAVAPVEDGGVIAAGAAGGWMLAARFADTPAGGGGEEPGGEEPGGGGSSGGGGGGGAPIVIVAEPAGQQAPSQAEPVAEAPPVVVPTYPQPQPQPQPLPPSRSCVRRGPVSYSVERFASRPRIAVLHGGQRVSIVVRVRRGEATIDPATLPRGRYTVVMTGRSRTHEQVRLEHTFRTCRQP